MGAALDGFGDRLARRGLTQTALGEAVGVSKRVIAYYEANGAQRLGAMLVELRPRPPALGR